MLKYDQFYQLVRSTTASNFNLDSYERNDRLIFRELSYSSERHCSS